MCAILIVIKNHPKSLYNDKNGPTKKYCIHGPLKKKRLLRISLNSAVSWERCRASDGLSVAQNPSGNFFARPRYVIFFHVWSVFSKMLERFLQNAAIRLSKISRRARNKCKLELCAVVWKNCLQFFSYNNIFAKSAFLYGSKKGLIILHGPRTY